MQLQIRIGPPQHEDYPAWTELWEGYNAFYGRSGDTALAPQITEVTWSRFFEEGEPMHALVARAGARLVGLAHFLYHRSTTQLAPICYLNDLFTAEAVRGRGVGRALIGAVCEHARAAGSPRVYWQTHETNTAAMKLYDKVAQKSGFLVYRHDL
jgi:GNAT superfamily N-acetyltransferase